MKRSTFNYIKEVLKDYPDIDKHIQKREEELRYPWRESDSNAGIKGNHPPDAMDNLLITIDQDKRLSALERNKRVVEHNLDICDDDTRIIIEELYLKKYPKYTMQGIVDEKKIFCSRSQAFKLRDRFFNNIADDLGLDK